MKSWRTPHWLAEVTEWIDTSLATNGRSRTGDLEPVQQQPGSAVYRLLTDEGDAYFKALAAFTRHEAGVTAVIADHFPTTLPPIYAINRERGWLLMADGGQRLREAFHNGLPMQRWQNVLSDYATLQMGLANQVGDLLAPASISDQQLARLPLLFEDLVIQPSWLYLDHPLGLSVEEHNRLLKAVRVVDQMCQELASLPIPDSIHHNDLHDANIFVSETGENSSRFIDWGDCSLAHPFFSLRTVFVSMENTFQLSEDDPLFDEYARAYLQPWASYASADKLWTAYQLARRLWAISSAVKYKRFIQAEPDYKNEYAHAVPGLLQEFLAANPDL